MTNETAKIVIAANKKFSNLELRVNRLQGRVIGLAACMLCLLVSQSRALLGGSAMSRAFDQTATAFYNTLRARVGGVVDESDLMSAASALVALGTVRPLIDMTTGKVLGYEYSMVTEKL